MKRLITLTLLLAVGALFAGCASHPQAPAYGHQLEFRQQLFRSLPVVQYGYVVKELRFSKDYQQALVVFVHPDSKTRPDWEFTLNEDAFGRYRGTAYPPFNPLAAPGTAAAPNGPVLVSVDLPRR